MAEPTTPTGRLVDEHVHDRHINVHKAVLAIEAEARQQERERLRALAEGIASPAFVVTQEWRRALDRLLADPDAT